MEFGSINSSGAAFVAGLVTSLHCVGMCGPLSCWLVPSRKQEDATTILTVYQGARLLSYALLGAVAGGLGEIPLALLGESWLRFAPWALVLFFLAVALRLDKRVPRPMWVARANLKLNGALRGRSRLSVAALLGLATPLLPCAPLYFLVAVTSFSGSLFRGVEFMLAFGIGTLPLLWFTQANFSWLKSRLSPAALDRLRIGIALLAAAVISWRLRGTVGLQGPEAAAWVCF